MSTAPTESPRFLGRYELVHLLGQGGMGEVYLAKLSGAAGFEKPCIVKTILPALLKDRQFLDRFHHEAKVLVHLVHSSIAQVYDMGEADGTYFMALEYVAGVDLAYLLEQARAQGRAVPLPVALYVGQKMAEGLGYAHRKVGPDGEALGIVHRDVSPHNAMVSYEGEVKVIDFGLAKSAARSKYTLPSTVMGKLGYMSPEQVRAEPLDHRSDIYSCAVVLWEMLAGRTLIPHGTVGEMMAAMSQPVVPSLQGLRPDVDAGLDAVVRRALTASPADRYARADDFARALNAELLRVGTPLGAEEVGQFVRALCPDAFAAQRKLIAKVSSNPGGVARTPPPGAGAYGTGLYGVSPAPGMTDVSGTGPTVVCPRDASAPGASPGSGGVAREGEQVDAAALGATTVRSPSGPTAPLPSANAVTPAPLAAPVAAMPTVAEPPRRRARGLGVALAALLLVGSTAATTAYFMKERLQPSEAGGPVALAEPGPRPPPPGPPPHSRPPPPRPGEAGPPPPGEEPREPPPVDEQGRPIFGRPEPVAPGAEVAEAAAPSASSAAGAAVPHAAEPASAEAMPAVGTGPTAVPEVKPASVTRPRKAGVYVAAKSVAEVKAVRGEFVIPGAEGPGLDASTSLQVVGLPVKAKGGKRRLLGWATVERFRPRLGMVQLRLDDDAFAAEEPRFVVLPDQVAPAPVAEAPAAVTPPPSAEPQKPVGIKLEGRVVVQSLGGLGLLNRRYVVHNASSVPWTDCKIMRAAQESARIPRVLPGRPMSVAFGDFKWDDDVPYFQQENRLVIQCLEGSGEFYVSR
ncbi:serine/threonine protein kinase [Corallococcus sp. H22C18031201]|nr:serine/threonine protein kinase [Corallococcus sp. H22C18031201]